MTTKQPRKSSDPPAPAPGYDAMLSGVAGLLEQGASEVYGQGLTAFLGENLSVNLCS